MIPVDLHSHTHFSKCGMHSIIEMLEAAKRLGMKALAITDHGPALGRTVSSVFYERVTQPVKDIRLLKGIEANPINPETGDLDVPLKFLKHLDIVLAGLHYNVPKGQDADFYTDYLIKCIINNPFLDIITHPNQPDFPIHFNKLARCVAENERAIELNESKSLLKQASDQSTLELIQACKKEGCKVTVNSDAHTVTEIGRDETMKNFIRKADFPEDLIINRFAENAFQWIEKRRDKKFLSVY